MFKQKLIIILIVIFYFNNLSFAISPSTMLHLLKPELSCYEQIRLRDKIIAYKRQYAAKEDTPINYLRTSKGVCKGLSAWWGYGMRLADEPERSAKKQYKLSFFDRLYTKLCLWDGKSKFNKHEQEEINDFIKRVIHYQERLFIDFVGDEILDLSMPFEFKREEMPVLKFGKDFFIVSKKMLKRRLQWLVKPGRMIFLGSKKEDRGHMMSIYQRSLDNKIYFYDPNGKTKAKEVKDINELVEACWRASHISRMDNLIDPCDYIFRRFGILVYEFSSDVTGYYHKKEVFEVSSEEILETFNDSPMLYEFSNKLVLDFIKTCNKEKILELLQKKIPDELRKFLFTFDSVKNLKQDVMEDIYEYLSRIDQGSKPRKTKKELNGKILCFKEELSFKDVLYVLMMNPGNYLYIENLLEKIEARDMSKEFDSSSRWDRRNLEVSLDMVVKSNIENNNFKAAKDILKIVQKRFGILPSIEDIRKYPLKLIKFMQENFSSQYIIYGDESKLDCLYEKVKKQREIEAKDNIIKQINWHFCCYYEENQDKPEMRKDLTSQALKFTGILDFKDVLKILSINPGNNALAERLLEEVRLPNRYEYMSWANLLCLDEVRYLLKINFKYNKHSTIAIILDIIYRRFNMSSFAELCEIEKARIDEEILEFLKNKFPNKFIEITQEVKDLKKSLKDDLKQLYFQVLDSSTNSTELCSEIDSFDKRIRDAEFDIEKLKLLSEKILLRKHVEVRLIEFKKAEGLRSVLLEELLEFNIRLSDLNNTLLEEYNNIYNNIVNEDSDTEALEVYREDIKVFREKFFIEKGKIALQCKKEEIASKKQLKRKKELEEKKAKNQVESKLKEKFRKEILEIRVNVMSVSELIDVYDNCSRKEFDTIKEKMYNLLQELDIKQAQTKLSHAKQEIEDELKKLRKQISVFQKKKQEFDCLFKEIDQEYIIFKKLVDDQIDEIICDQKDIHDNDLQVMEDIGSWLKKFQIELYLKSHIYDNPDLNIEHIIPFKIKIEDLKQKIENELRKIKERNKAA